MTKFFKRLFCKHYKVIFRRNIYGDEINSWNGKRSIWQCDNCGDIVLGDHLHHSEQEPKP
jgi:hypothetical protein